MPATGSEPGEGPEVTSKIIKPTRCNGRLAVTNIPDTRENAHAYGAGEKVGLVIREKVTGAWLWGI